MEPIREENDRLNLWNIKNFCNCEHENKMKEN